MCNRNVLHGDPHPDVLGPSEPRRQPGCAQRALRQELVGVLGGCFHDVEHLGDEV